MSFRKPADRFLLQGGGGPVAAFLFRFLIAAAEFAAENFLTSHDFDVLKTSLEPGRAQTGIPWRADSRGITAQPVLFKMGTVVVTVVPIILAVDAVAGHGAAKALVHPDPFRAAAVDIARADDDARDTCRGAEIADVLDDGITVGVDWPVKKADRHEGVGLRAEAVVLIYARTIIDVICIHRLWRQRRPSHEVGIVPPGHPGGSPRITGDPDPTIALQERPAAIVIGGPAKGLVGNPGPALIRVSPTAHGVWSPASRLPDGGLPDETILAGFHPLTVGSQAFVEHLIVAATRRRWGIGCFHWFSTAY